MFRVEALSLRALRRWLVLLGLLFGALFIALNPPYQGHDERAHMLRVHELSSGQVWSASDADGLYTLWPRQLDEHAKRFAFLRGADERHTDPRLLAKDWQQHWDEADVVRIRADAAIYAPISYAPQVVSEYLARKLQLSAPSHLYLARLAGLTGYLALVWLALGWLGDYRLVGFAIALMPMSLWQASTISADAMTNAFALLFVAWIVHSSVYESAPFSTRDMLVSLLLLAALGLTKSVYAPLGLMLWGVPRERFVSPLHKWGTVLPICLVAALPCVSFMSGLLAVPAAAPNPRTDSALQLHRLTHEPFLFVDSVFFTVRKEGWQLLQMLVGHFGRKSARILYVPRWLTIAFVLMLAMIVLCSAIPRERLLPKLTRWLAYTSALLVAGLSVVVMFLTYTKLEQRHVSGLQGRYFIPVLIAALIGLTGQLAAPRAPKLTKKLDVIVIGTVAVALIASVGTLLHVFYL